MRFNNKGLSLLEILVGLAIAGLGGALIMGIFISTNNIFVGQTIKVNQGLSLNQASLEISELIKSSAGVASQYPPTGGAQFATGSEVLVVKLPAVSQAGQNIDSVFDYAVITRDQANPKILKKYVYPDITSSRNSENKVLSTSLGILTFNYLDLSGNSTTAGQASRVNFIINLSETGGFKTQESSASSTINLKNLSQ